WWISVYSEEKLNHSRASADELAQITVTKADVARGAGRVQDPSFWSPDDLKLARVPPTVLTFKTKSGSVVTNAQVKPYVEGVSLVWRDTNGGGLVTVELADLPEDVRVRFGYDASKAAATDALDKERREREWQQ